MARTPTKQIPLGFQAPDFALPEPLTGKTVALDDVKGENGTLVMFICNHCPFVKHVLDELVSLGNDYMSKGIGMVAINPNDVENYPDDHPDKMKELAAEKQFPFPYLYDESQEVARAYEAACTPDFEGGGPGL
jgi:peroxiredoxin